MKRTQPLHFSLFVASFGSVTLLGAWLLALGASSLSAAPADPLEAGFRNPPDAAKPQTWWHWMNGNITRAGITADLEAMKAIGLGGATIVNVDCGIPSGPVKFMSPEWRADFKFAVQEADRLGLKLSVENCAGWSSSGGPWNTVTNAMQRLTASETNVSGPGEFAVVLPQPPVTLGYYRDIAVLAFKTPPEVPAEPANAAPAGERIVIQRAVFETKAGGAAADVTAKINRLIQRGQKSVVVGPDEFGDPAYGQVKQLRLEFTHNDQPGTLTVDEGETLRLPVQGAALAAVRSGAKTDVDRTFAKPPPASAATAGAIIPRDGILDLTANLGADGRLQWRVPAGQWTILRLGHTPTGKNNHPAPAEGTGLECDKFSQAALDAHWAGFMEKILSDVGPLAGRTLDTSLIDSYEVGDQDWTGTFREEFIRRRGYDPLKFLPVFTRRVVDNPAVTARFLWDMRRTIADLFAENYFGHFAELCRQHGLLNAVEPYTGPFESLQCGAPADVVMGEFWSGSSGHPSVKLAASIAHIYGKTIVGAESFTASPEHGRWQNDPYGLKPLGDLMFCQGLNRYIFHRYAHQPWLDRWPGMTMGQWGFHFERTETWWNQGKPWIDYISHCQFLLQQGRAVADVAYFTGESAPVEMREGKPPLPAGYDYDAVNAAVLQQGATVRKGRVTLASGASYAVLVLPPDDINLTPQMLACLRKLVRAGATVVGPRPQHSPSLAGYPQCDAEVKQLVNELWGACDGTKVQENRCGKGRVIWGQSLDQILAAQKLGPDFSHGPGEPAARLAYAHRTTGKADIYFVSNQQRRFATVECSFRVSGRTPELWHPDTGVIEPAPVWTSHDGRTSVRLDLDPAGSVFVVFRSAAKKSPHLIAAQGEFADHPGARPVLKIQRAIYGATDGAGEMDVTAKFNGHLVDGQVELAVGNDTFGRDPAKDHRKELRVDYTLDQQPGHATVAEGETLTLPPGAVIDPAPRWTIRTRADGAAAITAWSNGRVKLQPARGRERTVEVGGLPGVQPVAGEWQLSFPPHWGAPPSLTLEKLMSWTDSTTAGVRYFSGTATYEKELTIAADQFGANRELWLDLGAVKNFAEVSLNGQDLGVLWKPPFRVNLTSVAKPGRNRLVVKVTNLWPNRIIGDEQLPADCEWDGKQLKAWPQWLLDGKPSPTGRLTFTTWHHYTKDSPLLESGLIGPVTLQSAEMVALP